MIGVVGTDAGAITAALDASGESTRSGTPEYVLEGDPDAVVAVGTSPVSDLLRDRPIPDVPILAVDAGDGFPAVADLTDAVANLGAGRYTTVEYPVFGIAAGGTHVGNAVFDTMVVTSDPGRISEFRIVSESELGAVRADGVIVATPAGSHGYVRAAGGPRLCPGTDVAVVVPIAAFTMSPDQWVVGLDAPVTITSERDVPVSLLLDDERRELHPDHSVTVAVRDTIAFVSPEIGE
jgi:NAD+ kinase